MLVAIHPAGDRQDQELKREADDGLGLDDRQRFPPAGLESRQQDPKETIGLADARFLRSYSQNNELVRRTRFSTANVRGD